MNSGKKKSANQLWKESGTTLSFKDFISREKAKGFLNQTGSADIPSNKPLTDSINQVLDQMHKTSGLQTNLNNKYILGINKNVLIIVGIAALATTAILIYKHKMKKQ